MLVSIGNAHRQTHTHTHTALLFTFFFRSLFVSSVCFPFSPFISFPFLSLSLFPLITFHFYYTLLFISFKASLRYWRLHGLYFTVLHLLVRSFHCTFTCTDSGVQGTWRSTDLIWLSRYLKLIWRLFCWLSTVFSYFQMLCLFFNRNFFILLFFWNIVRTWNDLQISSLSRISFLISVFVFLS